MGTCGTWRPQTSGRTRGPDARTVDADFTVTVSDLLRDDIDVAIRAGTTLPPSMYAKRLTTLRQVCCASSDYLAGAEDIPHPRALGQHPVLAYGPASGATRWRFEGGCEQFQVEVQPRLRSDSSGLAKHACLAGQGVLRIPRFAVQDELSSGALVEVCGDWRQPEVPLWAIYPSRSDQNPAVAALLTVLKAHLDG